jgi:hypothetical protein
MKLSLTKIFLATCTIGGIAFAMYSFVHVLFPGAALVGLIMASIPTLVSATLPEGLLADVRKWHGRVDEQFANIDNLLKVIKAHKDWEIDPDTMSALERNRDLLRELNAKCSAGEASPKDHRDRNSLLKSTVAYCLRRMKMWAYALYSDGYMTITDLHDLHFLIPGETAGRRPRSEDTKELPDTKVKIINMVKIEVILDQSNTENAALIRHGWPKGVKFGLIVILSADGKTEIIRQMTPRLRTEIELPADARGKMFIAKTAFLKHVDDSPTFGSQQVVFTMPQTSEDLGAVLGKQFHEEFEEDIRTVEDHRRDVEEREREAQRRKKLDDEEKGKK